jgi:hypothetical protein
MYSRNTMRRALVTFALLISTTMSAQTATRRRAVVQPAAVLVSDDFRNGALGWQAGFSDYSTLTEPVMELESGVRTLPPELNVPGTGFFIQSHNRSDDVFMFLKKKLTRADGIRPNQMYEVSFEIRVASNAGGTECGGIGGAPGFSVYLKAGASPVEPLSVLQSDNHYRMNVDIGVQSQSGANASVMSTIENGSNDCRGDAPFRSLLRAHRHPVPVMSNEAGEIWLLVGTDSGFEGLTRLYYQSITARLTRL